MDGRVSMATKVMLLTVAMLFVCLAIIAWVPVWNGKDTFVFFDKNNTIYSSSNKSNGTNGVYYSSSIHESEQGRLFRVLSVVDGDTIMIDYYGKEESLRLIGINTPEVDGPYTKAECYGEEASAFSKKYLENQWVAIEGDFTQSNRDKYDRLLRYVYLTDVDFGGFLISRGYAYEYTYDAEYDKREKYLSLQESAEAEGRGFWAAGACDSNDASEDDDESSSEDVVVVPDSNSNSEESCLNIKGNISIKTGEKIYHLPWQEYYDETIISPEYGERYFCTEEEAINAGWRRSEV